MLKGKITTSKKLKSDDETEHGASALTDPSKGVPCDPSSHPAEMCPGGTPCPKCGQAICTCPAPTGPSNSVLVEATCANPQTPHAFNDCIQFNDTAFDKGKGFPIAMMENKPLCLPLGEVLLLVRLFSYGMDKGDRPIGALSWQTTLALSGAAGNSSLVVSSQYQWVGHGITQQFDPLTIRVGDAGTFTCTDGSETLTLAYKGPC